MGHDAGTFAPTSACTGGYSRPHRPLAGRTVQAWNQQLDPLFAAVDDQARSYVRADQLVETGIFQEVFSEPVRRLIASIQPSALLYHLHGCETAAAQTKPHIHQGHLNGWHKDWETLKHFKEDFPTFISIFILMSPVGDGDGQFEFAPRTSKALQAGGEVVRLVGGVGTAAIWNRSYYHRAAPNRGPRRRRILKISFQPAGLPNDRIGLDEFKTAWSSLDDPRLRALVDARRVGTSDPLPEAGDPIEARYHPRRKGTNSPGSPPLTNVCTRQVVSC